MRRLILNFRWADMSEATMFDVAAHVLYSMYIPVSGDKHIQLTLAISNSLISKNRLSRSENLVPA